MKGCDFRSMERWASACGGLLDYVTGGPYAFVRTEQKRQGTAAMLGINGGLLGVRSFPPPPPPPPFELIPFSILKGIPDVIKGNATSFPPPTHCRERALWVLSP